MVPSVTAKDASFRIHHGVIGMARVAYGDENSSPAVKALADQIRS
jgi:hypothetical protein